MVQIQVGVVTALQPAAAPDSGMIGRQYHQHVVLTYVFYMQAAVGRGLIDVDKIQFTSTQRMF